MDAEPDTPSDIDVCLNRLLDRSPVERLVAFRTCGIAGPNPWNSHEVHLMLVTEKSAVRVLISWEQAKDLVSELLPQFGEYNDPEDSQEHDDEPKPLPKRRKRKRAG